MNDKQLKAVTMPGDFIFHSSWFEIFKSFDMATAYAIFMAMIAYVQTGTVPADEALRRLTVFLFAHIETDRQRLLSLQPKRRTPAKKKPATEAPAPEPKPTPLPAPEPIKQEPNQNQLFDTSITSDTSIPPHSSQNSHNFHNSHNSHNSNPSQPTPDGSQNPLCGPLCGPRMRAARRARFLHYAQKVSAAIRQGQHLTDPNRVHKRIYKKRFTKHPSKQSAQPKPRQQCSSV